MAATLAGEVIEPIVGGLDPVPVDTGDAAHTELGRLRPLVDELAAWGGVYERWRANPLAAERPTAVPLNDADHKLVERLGGAEFGRLSAAAQRLAAVGAAGEALAAAAGAVGARLAQAWPGTDGAAAVQRWDAMRSAAADHGAAARQLGSRLAEATVAARGDLRVGVRRVLDSAERFQDMRSGTGADPYDWLAEIDQLERSTDGQQRRDRDRLARIRDQLDDMTARYARVITLLRGSLDAAAGGVQRAWDQLELDMRRIDPDPYRRLVLPDPVPAPPSVRPARRPAAASAGASAQPAQPPIGPSIEPLIEPPVAPGSIRAALDQTVADMAAPVTSATRAPSDADIAPPAAGGGPVLGGTEAQRVEQTRGVRLPQLPDGPTIPDVPAESEPGQPVVEPAELDTGGAGHPPEVASVEALLAQVVAFVVAVLAAFGLTHGP